MIGHNSASGGSTAPVEDADVRFRYMPLHLGDWLVGTAGMTLEYRGFYIEFLARLYDRGRPFPDDDRWMADLLDLSIRVWRRLKSALVKMEKIVVRNGCLTNSRFERERQKRAADMRKRAAAANARWHGAPKDAQIGDKTSEEVQASLGEVCRKFPANSGKKANKINDPAVQMDMLTNNRNPITLTKEETTDISPAAARVPLDEIEGLNGATLIVQTKIAKWINPYQPDYRTARQWLSNTVQMFGSDAVKEAFAVMETKMASGDVVGAPLKLMAKICQEKKRERDRALARKDERLAALSEGALAEIEADREKGFSLWS